jgi:hypothetical protein
MSSIRAIARLAWGTARWNTLRGHWFLEHMRHHRPFDARSLPSDSPIDVIVSFVDHFEPGVSQGHEAAVEKVASWCDAYEDLAARHRDSDGRPPQHTWFHRAEYRSWGCLDAISRSSFRGFGEVEFHLHHGHDTHESFAAKLQEGLEWFNQAGAMLTADVHPRQRFAYIAGNWSLDNGSGDDSKSGCSTELLALRNAGCYADFTFPALGSRAQPRKSNAIYYATDDPGPKSYDNGTDVAAGRIPSGDLMIFQGPLVVDWDAGRVEDGAVENPTPPRPDRIDHWLRANVHVAGRPEWVFVKLHTHGLQSRQAFLGPEMETLLEAMTTRWGRPPFRLHFVTARESYNIVKAAEAGLSGNPNDYRDFDIPRPANKLFICDKPSRLLRSEPHRLSLQVFGSERARISFASGPLRSVAGHIRRLHVVYSENDGVFLNFDGQGTLQFEATGPVRVGDLPHREPASSIRGRARPGTGSSCRLLPDRPDNLPEI